MPAPPGFRRVNGLPLGKHFTDETIYYVFGYRPTADDVFIVTYPKCGTTWMQHIVYYIYSDGEPRRSREDFSARTPFFEVLGAEAIANLIRPAAIKTHLPFEYQPYSEQAKYIYVARNPFDCCVSFYNHYKVFPEYDFADGTFDKFFEMFLEGNVDFGDYFHHLLSWYPHKNDSNVLFLTYEDLKKDVRAGVLKVAEFLGPKYGNKVRRSNGIILDKIVQLTDFESMKKVVNHEIKEVRSLHSEKPIEDLPRFAQLMRQACGDVVKKPVTRDFVRKGQVGDWRNYFTDEQISRLREKIKLETAGSDVMNLWKDLDFIGPVS
ncbi:sulfotransferase ssu-1-like [Ornithodoros turicata]|uniref:sulfotransferase ssu-1-like n=1 Tax=Ornithodoros turicata TaxID=34597 RepID=UPI00313A2D0A